MMDRRAIRLRIREGQEKEYALRHESVWTDVRKALKSHGFHNYSIFQDNGLVVLYMETECDFDERFQALHREPIMKQWRAYMDDVIIRDRNEGFAFMNCVFHLS